jgi:hemolysin activation/secretion protein
MCGLARAAAPDPQRNVQERATQMHEQRLRLLEEEQRRSLLTPPPQEGDLPAPSVPTPDSGACVHIRTLLVEGVTLLSRNTLEKITRPHENTCLSLAGINSILQQITNAYVQAGYITSRALLEPQDLSAGVLRIRVVEGRVESIGPDASSTRVLVANVQLFGAYDTGAIVRRDSYERGHVSGVAGGIRVAGALTGELAYAHPLEAPAFVRESEKRGVWYLSVKYTF